MNLFQTVAAAANRAMLPMVQSSLLQPVVGGWLTTVTYAGRRSGRVVTLPVGYRRDGGEIVIGVEFPGQKAWWRNFRGAGHPLSLRLDGVERQGHGVAHEDGRGGVSIRVTLAEQG